MSVGATFALLLALATSPVAQAEPAGTVIMPLTCPMAGELSQILPLPDGGAIVTCVRAEGRHFADARTFRLSLERRGPDLAVRWTVDHPLAQDPGLARTMSAELIPWHAMRLDGGALTVLSHDGLVLWATPIDLESGRAGAAREIQRVALAGLSPGLLPLVPVSEPARTQTLSPTMLPDRPRHLLSRAAVALSPSGAWVGVASVERTGALTLRRYGGPGLEPAGDTTIPGPAGRRGAIFASDTGDLLAVLTREGGTALDLVSWPRGGPPTVHTLDPGAALSGAPVAVWSQGSAWLIAEPPGREGAPAALWVAEQDPSSGAWSARATLPGTDQLGGRDRLALVARPQGGVVAGMQAQSVTMTSVWVPSSSPYGVGYSQQVLLLRHGPFMLVALDGEGQVQGSQVLDGVPMITPMTSTRSAWAWGDGSALQMAWYTPHANGRASTGGLTLQRVSLVDGALSEPHTLELGVVDPPKGVWLSLTPGLQGQAWLVASPAAWTDRKIRRVEDETLLVRVAL